MAEPQTDVNIDTLEQVAECLETLGFENELRETSVFVKVGGKKKPFTAVLIINDEKELVITCQLAKLGDFNDEALPKVAIAALDANTRIRPFAYGVITDADSPELREEEQWVCVLTDSIPMGDLSSQELESAMNSLLEALVGSREVLEIGLK